jgi:hypothetical protein
VNRPLVLGFTLALLMLTPAHAATATIEGELVIQTPMSAFVVDSMLKEFVLYAHERWGVTLKTRVLRAGTPVSYETIVKWKGRPEADVFWGGESALFDDLEAQKLLTRLDVSAEVWDADSDDDRHAEADPAEGPGASVGRDGARGLRDRLQPAAPEASRRARDT